MTALMPETFRDWLELVGLVFGAGVIVLIGWAVWVGARLWLDRRRALRQPPSGSVWAAELPDAAPVLSGRRPFAGKRVAK